MKGLLPTCVWVCGIVAALMIGAGLPMLLMMALAKHMGLQ